MTTVTITAARAHLGQLCARVKRGEEIGIIAGDQVLQLRPVPVRPALPGEVTLVPMTEDSVRSEYGVAPREWAAFRKREQARYARAKRQGRIVTFKGKFDPAVLRDEGR